MCRVDTDNDNLISQSELEEWIVMKVQEHFDEAKEETDRIFSHLDANKDGEWRSIWSVWGSSFVT